MKRAITATVSTVAGFGVVLGMHTATARNALSSALKRAAAPAATTVPAAPAGGGAAAGASRAAAGPPAPSTTVPGGVHSAVGTAEQYGYGVLSVKVTVDGKRITDISLANLQTAESYSQMLAQQVVPMLRQEVLSAQTARVNGVSGATYTSEAYLISAQSALDHLHVP